MKQIDCCIQILVGAWLLLCSIQDLKTKKINIYLIAAGFIGIIASTLIVRDISIWNRLAGASLGIILLCFNRITRGQIGIGDGLIVGVLGIYYGFMKNSALLLYALFGSAVFSIILIIFFKVNKKKTIPFVPFLLIAYLGVLFIE